MNPSFSIYKYLVIVMLFSWPFQIAYYSLGDAYQPILLVSMIMAGVATYICGKYIFKDGFAGVGWSWGKPKHYLYALLFALFLWLFPSLIERYFGLYAGNQDLETAAVVYTFLSSAILTILPAFGEEFSWRGYLLPRLLQKHSLHKALLIHGFITWFWHIPFLLVMATKMEGSFLTNSTLILSVSFIPAILHAVVFAYFWARSLSIAVVTAYHVFFDEIRDTIETTVGFGFLGANWQMIVITIFGLLLLWKGNWNRIANFKTESL